MRRMLLLAFLGLATISIATPDAYAAQPCRAEKKAERVAQKRVNKAARLVTKAERALEGANATVEKLVARRARDLQKYEEKLNKFENQMADFQAREDDYNDQKENCGILIFLGQCTASKYASLESKADKMRAKWQAIRDDKIPALQEQYNVRDGRMLARLEDAQVVVNTKQTALDGAVAALAQREAELVIKETAYEQCLAGNGQPPAP